MPLVRISIPAGKDDAFAQKVSQSVHDAMIATIDIPKDDRFQVITEHAVAYLVSDPSFLGIERSAEAMIVQISLRGGRTDEKKRALYKAVTENLHARLGVRPQDVMITLVENAPIDWSFGNGEAQYSPGGANANPAPEPAWKAFVPKLAALTDDVLFGDVWEDPALSKRDRSLVTCAVLAALFRPEQLSWHLKRAVDNGVTKEELSAMIAHVAFYAGWPSAVTAATVAGEVFG